MNMQKTFYMEIIVINATEEKLKEIRKLEEKKD